ncbi:MAG: class I SAM-dependent methyltransferase family protein [Thermoplasmata archaeon]|jgi:tRNA wybutosine-synthesizing protein 2
MRADSVPPAERVRAHLIDRAGADLARAMPAGYQRMGRVLLLRLPELLRPYFPEIGAAWQREIGVTTVLTQVGPIEGEARRPTVEVIAGGPTETEVVEHGIRWRFDAARIMFAAGNRTERARVARRIAPNERILDMFAGIGYFTLPAARAHPTVRVRAIEQNPEAYRYLVENARLNGVADRVEAVLGDNRTVGVPAGRFDRIFLGYLPSALPWVPIALRAARPEGAELHLHTVADVRGGAEATLRTLAEILGVPRAALDGRAEVRRVKPYGPGRDHLVVDLRTPVG